MLTNAHVVAGVNSGLRIVAPAARYLPATVVHFDPRVDVAVLYVPGLSVPPLQFGVATHPSKTTPSSRDTR